MDLAFVGFLQLVNVLETLPNRYSQSIRSSIWDVKVSHQIDLTLLPFYPVCLCTSLIPYPVLDVWQRSVHHELGPIVVVIRVRQVHFRR